MAKRNLGLETNDVRVRHPRLAPSYKRTRSPRVVIKDFAMYRKFALCSLVCLFFFNFIWNEKINVVVLNLVEFFSAAPSTWGWSPHHTVACWATIWALHHVFMSQIQNGGKWAVRWHCCPRLYSVLYSLTIWTFPNSLMITLMLKSGWTRR